MAEQVTEEKQLLNEETTEGYGSKNVSDIKLELFDGDGKSVKFSDIYSSKPRTFIVFLRHFLWLECHDRAIEISELFISSQDKYDLNKINVIAIANGSYKYINKFKKSMNFIGDAYADPSGNLYASLNMTKYKCGDMTCCERITCPFRTLFVCCKATYLQCCKCWCTYSNPGDISQLGGMIILDNKSNILYQFIDYKPGLPLPLNKIEQYLTNL